MYPRHPSLPKAGMGSSAHVNAYSPTSIYGAIVMRLFKPLILLLVIHSLAFADMAADKAAGAQALGESRFEDAVEIHSALANEYPEDGEVRYRLAIALMSLDRLDEASVQFEAAGEANYQPLGVAYRLARIHARQGNVEAALVEMDKMAAGGFPAPQLIENESDFDSLRDNQRFVTALGIIQSNRFPCRNDENKRLFDFWVSDWDVSSLGQAAGSNDVQLILGDCVVFENWQSVNGNKGKSFNYYDAGEDHWRQIWVDDTGGVIEFTGRVREGVMYYTASTRDPQTGTVTQHKLTFTQNADGSVRQFWEQSSDEGETWTVAFDGHYVKKVP